VARINLEDSVFKDNRFIELVMRTGSMRNALGSLIEVWIVAQRHWFPNRSPIPKEEWAKHKLDHAVIEAGLAVMTEAGVQVCGAEEHFAWMFAHHEKSRKGGLASAEARKLKYGNAQPSGPKTEAEPNHSFGGDRTCPKPLTQTLTLSQTQTPSKTQTEFFGDSLRSSPPSQRTTPRSGAIEVFARDEVCSQMLLNVPARAQEAWIRAYPDIEWLGGEIRKAYAWCESNPKRAPKQVARFLANWFSRAYEAHRKNQSVNSTASTRNADVLKDMHRRVKEGKL